MNAQYLVKKESTIIVRSDCFVGTAVNMNGDFVPACPDIEITARITGEWDSDEQLCRDMNDCIEKLNQAFENHYLSGNQNGCNHCNKNGQKDRFKNLFKNL